MSTATTTKSEFVTKFMDQVRLKNEGQPMFHQAVEEFVESIEPFYMENKVYRDHKILERIVNPDRIIVFRVVWEDDKGEIQVNRGYRVQFNNSIGPYKGGLRFHPSVNLGVLKFLAFEQIFKNSLTTLPMGGGKGGSDFDPKGKSDREVERFCRAFATELSRYIGASQDVPAGDIGVGAREIGYLFGTIKTLKGDFQGVLTGKGMSFGGSNIRPEATGYGAIYFMQEMLATRDDSFEGKNCLVSGSGNVAQFAAEKIIELGGKVLTVSDSGGTIYDRDGINTEKLRFIMDLKNVKRGRISDYVLQYPEAEYLDGQTPWSIPCDLAFPCATQNELNGDAAETLLNNGCFGVAEGANMPSDLDAVHVFKNAKILYGPGKAANAGGVAVSGLEMAQNSMRISWSREETDAKLKVIMKDVHEQCRKYGTRQDGTIDYVTGANVAGFVKVADAMVAFGIH